MNKREGDEHKQWSEKVRSQRFCPPLLDKNGNQWRDMMRAQHLESRLLFWFFAVNYVLYTVWYTFWTCYALRLLNCIVVRLCWAILYLCSVWYFCYVPYFSSWGSNRISITVIFNFFIIFGVSLQRNVFHHAEKWLLVIFVFNIISATPINSIYTMLVMF